MRVLEKQRLFAEKYYEKNGGWSLETISTLASGGTARKLGMQEIVWAHFERMGLADEDAMRDCYEQTLTVIGWRTDDGQHSNYHREYFFHTHKYFAGLVAPEGTFDLDRLLSDCPEPGAPLLDDNSALTCFSFPARLFLGELLERAGMHEQALAQVQPTIGFSQCNTRLKIRAWLLLGRCHAAMGHKVSA